MGNVLLYTLLMAGITFAIGFFVAFVIKVVFDTIQRMTRTQTVESKEGMHRVRHINRIRKRNYLSIKDQVQNNRFAAGKDTGKLYTNELVEYYYGKS